VKEIVLGAAVMVAACQDAPEVTCPGAGGAWRGGAIDGTEGWIPDEVATSESDVWIAGRDQDEDRWLLAHFDGAAWSVEPFEARSISALWAGTSGDVWLATQVYATDADTNPLWHREDGEWRRAPPPPRTLSSIALWSSGEDDVWVADSDDIYRLQDGEWTDVHTHPGTSFDAICGTSRDDIWVVEGLGAFNDGPTLVHWDGQRWTEQPVPADLVSLSHLSCTEAGPVAVATLVTSGDKLARWRGGDLTLEAVGDAEFLLIEMLYVRAVDDIWLRGLQSADAEPRESEELVAHYDGCRWSSHPDVLDLERELGTRPVRLVGVADGRTWLVGRGGLTLELAPR